MVIEFFFLKYLYIYIYYVYMYVYIYGYIGSGLHIRNQLQGEPWDAGPTSANAKKIWTAPCDSRGTQNWGWVPENDGKTHGQALKSHGF